MTCDDCSQHAALAHHRGIQLDRLLANIDTQALAVANMRVVELEQTVMRLNQKIQGRNR